MIGRHSPWLTWILGGLLLASSGLFAYQPTDPFPTDQFVPVEEIDTHVLPALDHAALIERDKQRDIPGPEQIAELIETSFSPTRMGTWEFMDDGSAIWRMRIISSGALSLNFGFSHFSMPDGAHLRIYSPLGDYMLGPFTSADNKPHGELWTPILPGDEAVLEMFLPYDVSETFVLELDRVHHGYKPFMVPRSFLEKMEKSGSCNVDVVCPDGDGWRDQIRAVGAYVRSGMYLCTGTAINNTAQDGTPYFLTADHCGITTGNDHTIVVYWNYENSFCRTPGSISSGSAGNGSQAQSQTGSTLRASYGPSDMALIELDNNYTPSHNVYIAGWDRAAAAPPSAVGIHHPQGEEKRISFENQATAITAIGGGPGSGSTHIRVADWDVGTTEGGSSGSALFNPAQLVVGQLEGGFAACGNNLADWYGRFFTSWTGGGTNSTRLSNWLDPSSTGATTQVGSEHGVDGWMRDDTNDDGEEPSQATYLYQSPDIWVRDTQDVGLAFQHMHQNPEYGQTNYVYVKLRNRGTAAANGQLHLYWSKASTGLSWPTTWNNYIVGGVLHGDQIGTVNVTALQAGDDTVLEFPWNPPNPALYTVDVHHFCLLARWVSVDDPMTVAETTSVGNNTRNNNNIAWKNVSVVNDKSFVDGKIATIGLMFANPFRRPEIFDFRFVVPREDAKDNWLDHGRIIIDLGRELGQRWARAGGEGTGIKRIGEYQFEVTDPFKAGIGGLKMDGFEAHAIKVVFELQKPDKRRKEPYLFRISQFHKKEEVGGEFYQITPFTSPK